jgi:hypothetical protein
VHRLDDPQFGAGEIGDLGFEGSCSLPRAALREG